jgi:hypothetical protein
MNIYFVIKEDVSCCDYKNDIKNKMIKNMTK